MASSTAWTDALTSLFQLLQKHRSDLPDDLGAVIDKVTEVGKVSTVVCQNVSDLLALHSTDSPLMENLNNLAIEAGLGTVEMSKRHALPKKNKIRSVDAARLESGSAAGTSNKNQPAATTTNKPETKRAETRDSGARAKDDAGIPESDKTESSPAAVIRMRTPHAAGKTAVRASKSKGLADVIRKIAARINSRH